jgi:hypothetical protein
MKMIDYKKFPEYYKKYLWSGKHKLFGYPPDSFPEFRWIASLEKRFAWVVSNYSVNPFSAVMKKKLCKIN